MYVRWSLDIGVAELFAIQTIYTCGACMCGDKKQLQYTCMTHWNVINRIDWHSAYYKAVPCSRYSPGESGDRKTY